MHVWLTGHVLFSVGLIFSGSHYNVSLSAYSFVMRYCTAVIFNSITPVLFFIFEWVTLWCQPYTVQHALLSVCHCIANVFHGITPVLLFIFEWVTLWCQSYTVQHALLSICHCIANVFHGITPVLLFIFSGAHYDVTLASHCNAACHCTTDVFMPVCDQNKTLYFSPCHAGCLSRGQDGVVSDRSLDGVVGDEFRWCGKWWV